MGIVAMTTPEARAERIYDLVRDLRLVIEADIDGPSAARRVRRVVGDDAKAYLATCKAGTAYGVRGDMVAAIARIIAE